MEVVLKQGTSALVVRNFHGRRREELHVERASLMNLQIEGRVGWRQRREQILDYSRTGLAVKQPELLTG